ncbi:UNVERIFIED_CONTAM: hypothetical protein FKN15_001284 [Acipenser sinensis]
MSSQKQPKEGRVLEVRFVGDEEVLQHIVDKQEGVKVGKNAVQTLVSLKTPRKSEPEDSEDEDHEVCNEQDYVEALGTAAQASELARTPGKSVKFSTADSPPQEVTSPTRASNTPNLRSDSDSDFSPSNSEEELEAEEEVPKPAPEPKPASKAPAAGLYKTPAKKTKKAPEPSLVEEYFEAHSSSKVLTSDRTLQKLQTPQLDQETLCRLLDGTSTAFSEELKQLNKEHERLFHKWMLQLQVGFNIVLFGLGSKRTLLEKFRTSMLLGSIHVVINGFFPSITIRSILNSITEEVLEHEGHFRNPLDQLDFIVETLKQVLTELSAVNLARSSNDPSRILNSITEEVLEHEGHFRNPLDQLDFIVETLKQAWDQFKMSQFNWLWYETTTYQPYIEETSYENSLLVKQSGALALSSLTHVMRSLTPNAR